MRLTAADVPCFVHDPNVNSVPLFREWNMPQDNLYLDYELFYKEVLLECSSFNAIVYTADWLKLTNCERLICAKFKGVNNSKTQIRCASNIHTKLYYVKRKRKLDIWIGSGNLVSSKVWHNVMMKVDNDENILSLKYYFDRLWSMCEPLKQE